MHWNITHFNWMTWGNIESNRGQHSCPPISSIPHKSFQLKILLWRFANPIPSFFLVGSWSGTKFKLSLSHGETSSVHDVTLYCYSYVISVPILCPKIAFNFVFHFKGTHHTKFINIHLHIAAEYNVRNR